MSKSKSPSDPHRRRGGNPPEAHRFKPGVSGNPGGRPRKKADLREAFRHLLDQNAADVMSRDPKDCTLFEVLALTLARKSTPREMVALLSWLDGAQPSALAVEAVEQDVEDPDDAGILEAAVTRRLRRIQPTRASDPEEA